MTDQPMGRFRRFVPPIEKGGYLIGGVVEFTGFPRALDESAYRIVGSLTVAGTEDNGDGTWDIWFEGGVAQCSKTEVQGAGNSFERIYDVLMGGNAVGSNPALDPFTGVDATARADGFPLDKGAPGHRLVFVQGDARVSAGIVAVAPMGRTRSPVNWNPDSANQPTIVQMRNLCNNTSWTLDGVERSIPNVYLGNEGGTLYLGHTETGIWTDTSETASDGSSTATMDEKQFDEDNPSYYPPDASFDASDLEYFYNGYGVIRYGTAPMANGGYDRIQNVYWVTWTDTGHSTTATVGEVAGLSPTAGTIPTNTDTSDDLTGVWRPIDAGNFDVTWYVTSGAGGFELRASPIGTGSAVAGFLFDDSVIGNKYQRTTTGGALAVASPTTGGSYTGTFQVRAARSGSTVTLYHRQDNADSWKTAASWTAGNDDLAVSVGFVSWSGETLKVFAATDGAYDFSHIGDGAGTVGVRRVLTIEVDNFDSYQLTSTTAITAVENLTTGETMSLVSSAFDRTKYGLNTGTSPSTLILYAETAGDLIQVTQAAASGSSSAPGEAPRVANITDLATEGSTSAAANRGNAYDVATIEWPHDGDPPGAGTDVEIWGDCKSRDNDTTFLWYDVKNDDDTDWAQCDSDECPFQIAAAGQFWLTQDFLDGLGGAQVCFAMGGSTTP